MKKGTLIKTFKGTRVSENGNKYNTLLIFYRDENGNKKTLFYDRPTYDYYILKDKNSFEATHPPLYIDINKLEKHTVYYDNLYRDIAENTGALSFYDKVKFNYGINSFNMNNLLKHPLLYNADMALEDFYIAKFYKEFEPDKAYKLQKCYFDIENDIYRFQGFPDPKTAPCPICLITLIDETRKTSHTFILRNKNNPQINEFENNVSDFKEYMHKKINELDKLDLNFEFYFYDKETDLIVSFFKKVHEIDPDYIGGWNISFDCQTLINRLKNLYQKEKIKNYFNQVPNDICDNKYLVQETTTGKTLYITPRAYYAEGAGKIGKRIDSFSILDGCNWTDQMLTYAAIHAPEGKPDSYSLDNISNIVLGKEKLPFENGETIRNQLYRNFRRFVEYNIRDVLLLLEIEDNKKDLDTVQQLSNITFTRKEKVFKKSIALTNYINKYALERNLAMRTNKNMDYGEESSFYDANFSNKKELTEFDKRYLQLFNRKDKNGAYVADPNLNDEVGKEIFKKVFSKFLFEYVCDEDFSSLYPSIIRAFNLDSLNIVGKFYLIDDEANKKLKENKMEPLFKIPIKNSKEEEDDDEDLSSEDSTKVVEETDDSGLIISDILSSQDYVKLGEMYFNLPSTEDIIKDLLTKK